MNDFAGSLGHESWLERDRLMALDADPEVVGVAAQPIWLRWIGPAGPAWPRTSSPAARMVLAWSLTCALTSGSGTRTRRCSRPPRGCAPRSGGTISGPGSSARCTRLTCAGSRVTAELGDNATPVSVRFQGRTVSPVDDLVVSGSARDEERRVSIGVRRAPDLVTSDKKTARLLAAYVQMVAERWEDITAGRWRLYLVVAVASPAVTQLRELRSSRAQPPTRPGSGLKWAVPDASTRVRARLVHVDALIASAAKQARTAAAGIDAGVLTWRVLHRLQVRVLQLEGRGRSRPDSRGQQDQAADR